MLVFPPFPNLSLYSNGNSMEAFRLGFDVEIPMTFPRERGVALSLSFSLDNLHDYSSETFFPENWSISGKYIRIVCRVSGDERPRLRAL